MIRQAKRREIRELTKEHRKITQSKIFQGLMKTNMLEGLAKEDMTLLKEKKHPNEKLQARFNLNVLMLQRLTQIEQRMKELNNK